ncbi:MAG: HDOD domain-containing protein [Desulfobacterales bacterium]|nr:HDOD domain-containing protein [Desulfobacterales bacterium]
MDKETIEKTVKMLKNVGIPSHPKILMDINKEVDKEEPDFRKISHLITQDVGISAKILKLCNSPFFGLRQKIDSIMGAVTLLGLDNIRNVILTSTLQNGVMTKNLGKKEFEYFCKHSTLIAKTAQLITDRLPFEIKTRINPSYAYMAGLFHDCAIPLLTRQYPDYLEKMTQGFADTRRVVDIEEANFQSNHCIAGYFVAKSWHLPNNVSKTILHHHDLTFDKLEDISERQMLIVLLLAESIVYYKDHDASDVFYVFNAYIKSKEVFENLLSEIDLNGDDLNDIEETVDEILEQL